MAGGSLLALLDDIATILDDVALMTKMAAKKTAGVLGDDLALNAQQVSGVKADRELPVVWAVAKGSLLNKCILVPVALLISAFANWAITPLLMIGGAFLCYEGVEKLAHKFLHKNDAAHDENAELANAGEDLAAYEKKKIKGAIRTDFILSAEIIVIALGTVAAATFLQQVLVLIGIALLMTMGVYGLVAGIVKLDDLGLYLSTKSMAFLRTIGNGIVRLAPYLMKFLSVVGTVAMFMVGGGILTHGLTDVNNLIHDVTDSVKVLPDVGVFLGGIVPVLLNIAFGLIAGAVVLAVVSLITRVKHKFAG